MIRSGVLGFTGLFLALVSADAFTQSGVVHPQQMSARDLLLTCSASKLTSPGRERRRYCDGFVSGVEEGARIGSGQPGARPDICAPAEVTARRLAEAYVLYAADHRNDLERPAAAVVLDALREAYPCSPGS